MKTQTFETNWTSEMVTVEIIKNRNLNRPIGTKDVARLLKVTESTVKRWCDTGKLICNRSSGDHRRFAPEDIAFFYKYISTKRKRR